MQELGSHLPTLAHRSVICGPEKRLGGKYITVLSSSSRWNLTANFFQDARARIFQLVFYLHSACEQCLKPSSTRRCLLPFCALGRARRRVGDTTDVGISQVCIMVTWMHICVELDGRVASHLRHHPLALSVQRVQLSVNNVAILQCYSYRTDQGGHRCVRLPISS